MQRYTIRLASYGNFFAPREPEPSEHLRDPHTTALALALVVVRVERTLGTHSIAATFDALALVAGSQTGTGDVGMACESGVVVVSLCAANDNRPHSFVFARSFNAECVLIQFDAFPTCTWMSVVVRCHGVSPRLFYGPGPETQRVPTPRGFGDIFKSDVSVSCTRDLGCCSYTSERQALLSTLSCS